MKMPMQNGHRTAGGSLRAETVRTTLVLPATIDQNLEVLCAMRGVAKGEVIKTALFDFLSKQGLQPDKSPKDISVVY